MKNHPYLIVIAAMAAAVLIMLGFSYVLHWLIPPPSRWSEYLTALLFFPVGITTILWVIKKLDK